MTRWKIVRSWEFRGPAEPGADCAGGMAFALEPCEGGEERALAVQWATLGRPPSPTKMRNIAKRYLDEPDPPRYVTLDREGRLARTS
jgi:hypothetical protein